MFFYRHRISILKRPLRRFFIRHLFVFGSVFSCSEALLRTYTRTIDVTVRSNATEDGCRRTTSAPLQSGASPRTRLRTVRECRADRFVWWDILWFLFRRLRARRLLVCLFYESTKVVPFSIKWCQNQQKWCQVKYAPKRLLLLVLSII